MLKGKRSLVFNIKSRINIQPSTNNSVSLKQLSITFTYQTGRNVKALIIFSVTDSMEKWGPMDTVTVFTIILKCTYHWKPVISLLAVDPKEILVHEHKGAQRGSLLRHWF